MLQVQHFIFCVSFGFSLFLLFGVASAQQNMISEFLWHDPAKIVTAEPCGECHAQEYEVWKKTKHATGFKTTHRKKSAESIATAMGFRLMKRQSLCLKCHYLGIEKEGQLRAASGVSCESCHGAARDWINIHNDYGKGFNFRTESPEHKANRIIQSKANGMNRPSELYDVVANCFQCHNVPHEELVDIGGHVTGSADFEFVQRASQIQHNFLQAQFNARSTQNMERSPERKRIMYIVGRAVDLEYSLRGVAQAQKDGEYLREMQRRFRRAINKIRAINKRASIPEITEILQVAENAEISSIRQAALLDRAERIAVATKRLIASNDGSGLSAIDDWIVDSKAMMAVSAKGKPDKRPGRMQKFKTIGAGCSCHREQQRWWPQDAHALALRPFTNKSRRNIEIALRYGLEASELTKGTSRCMDCHATVISGDESEEAFEGVGCEGCHGAAEKYKNEHQEKGYAAGKKLGMRQLLNLRQRAEVCASCHYITEEKLLAAGHTSGADFDFAARNKDIQHWQGEAQASGALVRAYERIKLKRGPVPKVTLVSAALPLNPPISTSDDTTEDMEPLGSGIRQFSGRLGPIGYVTAMCLNVRASANSEANIVGFVFQAERLSVDEAIDDWVRVTNKTGAVSGWVSRKYLSDSPVETDFIMPEDYGEPKTPTVIEGISAKYVGVAACKQCHSKPSAGFVQGPFGVWSNHLHSSAFESLGKPYAFAFAKKRRVGNPQKDWRCAKCHTAALGISDVRLAPTFRQEEGVGCEVCHGPGGDYLKPHTDPNFDRGKLAEMGFRVLRDMEERDKFCRKCHNELSPTYKPFDVVSFSAIIRHWETKDGAGTKRFTASVAQEKLAAQTPPDTPTMSSNVAPPTGFVANSSESVIPAIESRLVGIPNDWQLNLRGGRGKVLFPHFKHLNGILVAGTKQEVCQVCHHTTEAGKRPTNCSDNGCHLRTTTKVSKREDAFHGTCRACHRQERRGPRKCAQCHVA